MTFKLMKNLRCLNFSIHIHYTVLIRLEFIQKRYLGKTEILNILKSDLY